MIEVIPHGNGWRWRMITSCGRTLLERTGFATDMEAAESAKRWRTAFWRIAAGVDHRMAACI